MERALAFTYIFKRIFIIPCYRGFIWNTIYTVWPKVCGYPTMTTIHGLIATKNWGHITISFHLNKPSKNLSRHDKSPCAQSKVHKDRVCQGCIVRALTFLNTFGMNWNAGYLPGFCALSAILQNLVDIQKRGVVIATTTLSFTNINYDYMT